jgi:SAM-dependent methyltransferase
MLKKIKKLIKLIKRRILAFVVQPTCIFSLYMRLKGTKPNPQRPHLLPYAGVLRTQEEVDMATRGVEQCGLYPYRPFNKNWDSLAALSIVMQHADKKAKILDAGGEIYSTILPWLHSYGYENLVAVNLCFTKPARRGRIHYLPGDITKLQYPDNSFDAITCLSVLEHHVPVESFFREMHRVLKPGGVMVVSVDYWDRGVDTKGKQAYGGPIKIFDETDIDHALEIAKQNDLDLIQDIDLSCQNHVVEWMELQYTFIYFTVRKKLSPNTLIPNLT